MRHQYPRRNAPTTRSESIDQKPARHWMIAATTFVIAALAIALSGV